MALNAGNAASGRIMPRLPVVGRSRNNYSQRR